MWRLILPSKEVTSLRSLSLTSPFMFMILFLLATTVAWSLWPSVSLRFLPLLPSLILHLPATFVVTSSSTWEHTDVLAWRAEVTVPLIRVRVSGTEGCTGWDWRGLGNKSIDVDVGEEGVGAGDGGQAPVRISGELVSVKSSSSLSTFTLDVQVMVLF